MHPRWDNQPTIQLTNPVKIQGWKDDCIGGLNINISDQNKDILEANFEDKSIAQEMFKH